jgi:tetratricopeptide (TPR) repeat protein
LQVATTLEPQRAILRSYLGKGWGDVNDLKHARKELVRANELDPNDPTSWLYLALVDQQANRLNESVQNLERSEELNDNRSIFRSRLMLDQDQAVRAANLAVIYRDVGMYDRSVQEAARAVDADYANYSAHLFLADSFDALRDPKLINLRYETPWFSELLVANLLAPPNAGTLSQNISQQEYSKLFASDGFGLFSRTDYSSHGDWVENGSQYGVFGNFAYSLDAYYRTERGFRPNNDLEQLNLAARSKWQITEKDSLFAQVSYFDSDSGDVAQYYDQRSASKTFRAEETQRPDWPGSVLAGYHREWSPGNHTLAMFGWFDDTLKLHDSNSSPLARISFPFIDTNGTPGLNDFVSNPSMALNYQSELVAYSAEVQQIFQTHQQTLIAGIRYQTGTSETKTSLARPADPNNPFSVPIFIPQSLDTDLDRLSIYAYEHWQLFDNLRLIGGVFCGRH